MEMNEKAADFTLAGIDRDGEPVKFTLSEHLGKPVILFFYPQDDTPNCTIEAVDFSNNFGNIEEVAEVAGISRDNLESHKEFQNKYDLKITLLSDTEGKVTEEYGLCEATDIEHKKFIRSTFLIDREGKIAAMWKDVDVNGHAEEVMRELRNCI